MKIALGFRFAQTLLNLAFARFVGAIFATYLRDFKKKQNKSKSNSEFASLMSFFSRFARFRKQTWKVRTHSGCSDMQVIDG